jgi:lambda family phage portal protein
MNFHDLSATDMGAGAVASISPGPAIGPPAYRAASGLSQELATYWPGGSSGNSAVLPSMRMSLDRTRDLIRNDPHAAAGVDRLVDMVVGHGWQLVATPDARALGLDAKTARDIGRQIRSEWRLFARDPHKMCDARRFTSMNGLFRQAARTIASAGEACAVLKFRKAGESRYQTNVALVDPDRLCNPNYMFDSLKVHGGIEFDAHGAAIAYHVRDAHPNDYYNILNSMNWTRIPRETWWRRPVFVHAFEGEREDQARAITPFASLVARLRMLGKFADTELAAATANALIAATVESELPVNEVADSLAAPADGAQVRASWVNTVVGHYTDNPATLGGVRIPVMLPGSKITMNSSPRQTTAFPAFQTAFLRSIAARLGISYEQLSQDFSQTNYSSARAALNETYRTIKRLQAVFAEQFVMPIYMAFLEEAFDKGYIKIPANCPTFDDMPAAWSLSRWIGPGRGYIDPVKEAEAGALRMETLVSTLELECADQGLDHIEILDELELEAEELAARGLTRQSVISSIQSAKGVIAPTNPELARAAA